MSPEQLNAKSVDHRSDIYSLGIVAFELATGHPPFEGSNWWELVTKHLSQPIPEFAGKSSGIPYWFQELVTRAAAKEPEKRFQTAEEFARFIAKHHDVRGFDDPERKPLTAVQPASGSEKAFPAFMGPAAALVGLAILGAAVVFAAYWMLGI
jgi:serine/threonine protein kinase